MDDNHLTGAVAATPGATAGATSYTVCKIEDIETFRSLRPEWDQLLSQSSADCIFLTWEWLFTWWKHLSAGRKLQIIAVRSNGQLVGIAPLTLRPAQLKRLIPFRMVEFLGTGTVGSDYLDVIVKLGLELPVLGALRDYLVSCNSVLEFSQLNAMSSQASLLAGSLARQGWQSSQTTVNVCTYIDLSPFQSWDSYVAQLGSRHRRNLRQRMRGLTGGFEIGMECVADERSRDHCFGIFLDLHDRRWGQRGGSDAFDGPGLRAFHNEFSRIALAKGWLRLRILRLDGIPAAAVYGFRYRDVFYYYQAGFDPAYAQHSVGLCSLGFSIKDAMEEGAREYDMLHGTEPYKALWAKDCRYLHRIHLYPPGPYGKLCVATMRGRERVRYFRHLLKDEPKHGEHPPAMAAREKQPT